MMEGKIAVVTGGFRGIGKAIALELARNGADIALLDVGSSEAGEAAVSEISGLGRRAKAYSCDVSDFSSVEAAFQKIGEDLGKLDILVNNAGITRDKLLLAMKEEDFDSVIGVNLKGAFNTIKQAYPIMMRKRSGRIINVSSVSGMMGNAGQANYSASKAGIIGLTKTVAKELAGRNVTCNAIAPGFVSTDMTVDFEGKEEFLNAIPLKRFAKPEEIAKLVAFLASEDAGYITGEVIRIDGGMAM